MPELPLTFVTFVASLAARHGTRVVMNYSGIVCLLICGLSVVFTTFLLPRSRESMAYSTKKIEAWIVIVATGLVLWTGRTLTVVLAPADPMQVVTALFLTEAAMAGVFITWIVDVIRGRLIRMEEEALHVALLVAPLVVVLLPGLFPSKLNSVAIALWFINGVIWQVVCTQCVPSWDRALCRREDPPDLGVLSCHGNLWEKFPRTGKG